MAILFGVGLTGTALAAPVPGTPPSISPTTPTVNAILTVTQGGWTGQTGITDVWEVCNSAGASCTPTLVSGTTSYQVSSNDVGKTIKVAETATDGTTTVEQDSNITSAVPPVNTVPPQIKPNPPAYVGNTLVVNPGNWPHANTVTDTWEDCDASGTNCVSTGTTGSTYLLTARDVGHTIVVSETAKAPGNPTTPPILSAPTAVVVAVPFNTAPPTIAGTAIQGQTLAASPGAWTNNPTSYAYQWLDCDSAGQGCAPIPGAGGSTYNLTGGDVGHTVAVSVSGVNIAGRGPAAQSAATGLVKSPSIVSLAISTGNPVVNQTVTLVGTAVSQAPGRPPVGTLQFTDGGKPISGCGAESVAPTGPSVTVLCQTSFGVGPAQIQVTFTPSPSSVLLGAAAPPGTLNVARDTTTTALDVSSQVKVHGTTTYTATVAPPPARSGPIEPSGSVQFLDGGAPIAGCSSQQVMAGGATCTKKYAKTGRHSISARYLGDAEFTGSVSSVKPVRVTAPSARGTVTATMQWTFRFAPTYTRVLALVVNGAPVGGSVQVHCSGGGCPFAKRTTKITKQKPCTRTHKASCPAPGKVSLTSTLGRRNLGVGARITIMIVRTQFVGKYYSFTVRPRRQPRVRIACLAVGSTKPGVGC